MINNIYLKKIKNSWLVILVLIIYLIILILFNQSVFFWDSITIISKPANFLYENGLFNFIKPSIYDNGDPQIIPLFLAAFWKIFTRSIFISHIFFGIFTFVALYQLLKLTILFFETKYVQYVFALIAFEPVFMTQTTGMFQDCFLIIFSLLAIRAYFSNKKILLSISFLFLCMVSRRGMLTCFSFMLAIFFIEVFQNCYSIKQFAKHFFLIFIPAILFVLFYIWWRLKFFGWFFTTNDTNYGDFIQNNKMFFKNLATFFLYMLDKGKIFIWLVILIIGFKNKNRIGNFYKKNKKLFSFTLCLLLVLLFVTLPLQNPFGNRYFVVIYILLLIICSRLMIDFVSSKRLTYFFALFNVFFLTGHLWIYPEKMAKSWDCTLAHLPYYELRKQCFDYIDRQNMDYERISAGFCLYGDRGFTELNQAGKKVGTQLDNQYFIYSNISNLPDEWIDELHNSAHWKPLRTFEKWPVHITVFENISFKQAEK